MAQAPTEQRQWIMVVPGKLAVRFAVAVLLPSVLQRGRRADRGGEPGPVHGPLTCLLGGLNMCSLWAGPGSLSLNMVQIAYVPGAPLLDGPYPRTKDPHSNQKQRECEIPSVLDRRSWSTTNY